MALFDDEPTPRQPSRHIVGGDLSDLSVEELKERVALLKAEIARVENEISSKIAVISAASNIFKE